MPGHPRLTLDDQQKTWMPGSSPGMTSYSPLHFAGRAGKPFHRPDPLLQPPAILRRPVLEFAVDAEIMGPVMGDVGIILRLAADRDQIGLALLQHRFRLLGFEDDA